MAAALGSAAALLGKVFTMLSAVPVSAYVDSLELGHNSQQIKAKLAHTRGLLHSAQVSDVGHNPGLQDLLPALSRNADQAEDLLDELHYFQIHDKHHGTSYSTTQPNFLRHGRNALRHTATSWAACFSCPSAQDHDGKLRFHPVIFSRKIKSVLQDMQTHYDPISDLLGNIPSNSMAVTLQRSQIGSTIIQDTLYGRRHTFEETVNCVISCKDTVSVLPIVGPGVLEKQLSPNTSIMMQGCIVILGMEIILMSVSGYVYRLNSMCLSSPGRSLAAYLNKKESTVLQMKQPI